MKSIGFLWLGLAGVVYSMGCAQGSDSFGGDGGASSSNGGAGGATTSSGTGTGTGTGTTTGSGTSTSTSSGAGGDGGGGSECGADQHLCGGICAGNTPQTGCFTSSTCTACTAPPNSGAICSPDGACDFNCNVNYMKSGAQCVCAVECCSNADCPAGETCGGGTCNPPPCDMDACIQSCILQLCFGGTCNGPDCVCVLCM